MKPAKFGVESAHASGAGCDLASEDRTFSAMAAAGPRPDAAQDTGADDKH